jgi:hypothetical protein
LKIIFETKLKSCHDDVTFDSMKVNRIVTTHRILKPDSSYTFIFILEEMNASAPAEKIRLVYTGYTSTDQVYELTNAWSRTTTNRA